MKVIYLNVSERKEPEVIDIKDNNAVYSELIGCEMLDFTTRVIDGKEYGFICDDVGALKQNAIISAFYLPQAIPAFFGNLIITGVTVDEFTSLKENDIKAILRRFTTYVKADGTKYKCLVLQGVRQ